MEDIIDIRIVFDNKVYDKTLQSGWGFSCLINTLNEIILFDTGADGSILVSNIRKMDVDIKKIDKVFLSQIHQDHIGGLFSILDINFKIKVYLLRSFPLKFKNKIIEYNAEYLDVHIGQNIFTNFYSTGSLGNSIKEQSLYIDTTKGIIVITGCAHPGIINIIEYIKQKTQKDILLVLGGLHLISSQNKIQNVIKSFLSYNIKYVCPCHCSGDMAQQMFLNFYKDYYISCGVGRVIRFADL